MGRSMELRGPDAGGVWSDSAAGVGLAHARLSIIDLSEGGLQPMHSADGVLSMVYNGEIYNYMEIRRELEGQGLAPERGWRGGSDSEVLLEAIRAWGLETTLERLIGMFAFAVWDSRKRALTLVRDRMGIKPLYYGYIGKDLVFGSTLAPFAEHPDWNPTINRDVLALYLSFLYVPCPHSIYEGVAKLAPGTHLTIDAKDAAGRRTPVPVVWWSADRAAAEGRERPFGGETHEAAEELERLLTDAVRLRMIADVPLGAFLSGGVDSSTVVALMQSLSDAPVETFTIGADSAQYNEADHARAVAKHLGASHHELIGRPQDALDIVPLIPRMCDEPFADSSIIPTYMVSRLARRSVTVSLSGDGGDELFAGYNRYLLAPRMWRRISLLPPALRKALSGALDPGLMRPLTALVKAANSLSPGDRRQLLIADKTLKLVQSMKAGDRAEFHRFLASYWTEPLDLVRGARELPPTRFSAPSRYPPCDDYVHWMQTRDQATYLPDDILTKVDRASMAVSLEARVPILDHRVVEFSHSLPLEMKISNGTGKLLLRKILSKHVPQELIDRPKQGFGLPIDEWLRGPLKDWAEDLISDRRLDREGFIRPEPVRRAWSEHLSGRKNMPHHLWAVLMFQSWLQERA
jgi:asparagine synthase (glutamine-hydrolysing)